ncbi:MAG: DUF1549 domain-containing protein, partial [Candidatus Hydrogenedentes bacterium]|nr:DUF1549 domain-containing protein [Candidatus Hydrogenedentota bacterium]
MGVTSNRVCSRTAGDVDRATRVRVDRAGQPVFGGHGMPPVVWGGRMTRVAIALVSVFVGASAAAATGPFESGAPFSPAGEIDTLVLDTLTKQGIQPAHLCPDAVFIRRVYLDVTGTLPWSDDVRTFLADTRPGKRAEAIESLLGREEFADYWSLKWCDALRVKSEFPINLWPNAVQAYHRWIHDAVRRNMPYDDFARELLTSSGSNFRVPQVNFYRAVQARDPASLASAAALTFMGIRTDSWPEDRRSDLATFFSRVAY